jgi:hypothetical protein
MLQRGIAVEAPLIVMEVGEAKELAAYAQSHGIPTRILRAEDIDIEPTD